MTNKTQERVPVSIITGFLGSGKTTLLSKLLRRPEMSDAAVIINEFGEIGLDHHLVASSKDDVVVMSSGCLCCTIRTDLVDTLRSLHHRMTVGEIPRFRRVLVETTGLADPVPILHTLMNDPLISHDYMLDSVITTVDALHGSGQLDAHPESLKQAAVADRLLLTKSDLCAPEAIAALRLRLQQLNPGAPIVEASHGEVDPELLFNAGLYAPSSKSSAVRDWLRAEAVAEAAADAHHHHHHHHDVNRHDGGIQAHCLRYERPLNWRYFSPNLASLISRHAEKLLRVKGILHVEGEALPVVVHGVQHQFQRMRLDAWPDGDRQSRLVLIVRDLPRAVVEAWLRDDGLADIENL